MPVSSEDAPAPPALSEPRRAGRELLLEVAFRPVSNLLVPPLRRLRVPPPAVVLANAAAGLGGAILLARGELLGAALLVQLKTLLDNTDGQLARATGRTTLAGRYLDTLADLVVNAALFAALGHVTGEPVLAVAGFVALTLVLAADFSATELYREEQGTPTRRPPATGRGGERILATLYAAIFSPLDRAFPALWARAEVDRLTLSVLANLGLSTQLAALGLCLALDAPAAYLWIVLACLVVTGALLARPRRAA
jgi:phosphatidylglycerophosphate synthase